MSRKVPPQKPTEAPVTTAPQPAQQAQAHALELPRGAMIAFRRSSGGAMTEFYLYPDGRISFNTPDFSDKAYAHPERKLADGQIAHLRHLLEQTNFYRAESAQGKAEGVTYAISARVGNKSNTVELSDRKIQDTLKPLMEELEKLLPKQR